MAKRHSPKTKAKVVARALKGDKPKRQVARDAGISETTLFRWIKDEAPPDNVARLRAVPDAPDDPEPKKKRPATLAEAIASGNYLEILLAQQRDIAASLPDATGPAKAALHRQFSLVTKDIEALRAQDTDDDEIGKAAATPDDDWDSSAI